MALEGETNSVWWQTVLHVLGATIAFLPILFVLGLLEFIGALISGGAPLGIFVRAVQYGLAAYLSLYVPTFLLKRSNSVVAASVWGTMIALPFTVIALPTLLNGNLGNDWFGEIGTRFEILGSIVGFIAGTVSYGVSPDDFS